MLNTYILMSFLTILLLTLSVSKQEDFIIERNGYGESDRLIVLKQGAVTKSADFKNDGTCFGAKRHITSSNSKTISCYGTTNLGYIGTELCLGGLGVVEQQDTSYPVCKSEIINIASISLWNPGGWKDYPYGESNDFLLKQLSYKSGDLKFKSRPNWNGVLLRLFTYCSENSKITCLHLKFTGNRSYPLLESLDKILKPPPTPTTIKPSTQPTPTPRSPTGGRVDSSTPSPTQQNNVVPKKKKSSDDDEGPNAGLIIGAMLGFIVIFAIVLFLILYMKRRRRDAKYPKRQDSSNIYATTCDNVYDVRDQNEKSVMISTAVYTTPNNDPEYRELERQYDNPTHGVSKTIEERYDVPEQNNELAPRAYGAPKTSNINNQERSPLTEGEGPSGGYYSTPANQKSDVDTPKVPLSELYAQVDKTKK